MISFWMRKQLLTILFPLMFLHFLLAHTALAHHPFGMGDSSEISIWQALLSGIAHPLLGPDHLLFMLGLALVGIKRTKKLVFPLLAVALAGSAFVQWQPLPEFLTPLAEGLVSLSLVIEGLIALNFLSSKWLLPMFALHGYLLGSTIYGAEPTPLLGYFSGLLIAQGSLLILVIALSEKVGLRFGLNGRNLFAGIWIGIGLAFSWVAVIP